MNLLNLLLIKNYQLNFKNSRLIYLAVILFTFLFYSSTIHNEYNLDDDISYTENQNATEGLNNIKAIFTENTFKYFSLNYGYRPITTLSFAIENEFFGINSKVSHLHNIILYFTAVLLLFHLLKRVFPETTVGVSVAIILFFLAMPIHSEIVNNVKSRDELLMLNFGLLSALFALTSYNKNWAFIFPSLLFLVLSVLCKKTGLIFLGIIPVAIFYSGKFKWKHAMISTIPLFSIFIIQRLLKKTVKQEDSDRIYNLIENPLFDVTKQVDQLSLSIHSFWFYMQKMIFPTELVSYYGFDTIQYQGYGLKTLAALVIMGVLLTIIFTGLKKKSLSSFGAIILLGAIIPFLNIQTPAVGIVAERFATLSTIGYAIMIISLAQQLTSKVSIPNRRIILRSCLTIFLVTSFLTIQSRNKEWKNKLTLFEADVLKQPKSATLHGLIGRVYLESLTSNDNYRINNKIQYHLEKAVKITTDKYLLTDLANFYSNILGDKIKGAKYYQQVILLYPNYAEPNYHLGWNFLARNDTVSAINSFQKTIQVDPNYLAAYEPLIRSLLAVNREKEAISVIKKGVSLFPNNRQLSTLYNSNN